MFDRLRALGSVLTAPRQSPDNLKALQGHKLRLLVRHAYLHVPYYRRRFQAAGLGPDDVRTLDDLERIPVTTKPDLQVAGIPETLSDGVDAAACFRLRTTGSTGTPLAIYLTPLERRVRSLVELRTLRTLGFSVRDRLVSVGPHLSRSPRLTDRLGVFSTHVVPGLLRADEQLRRLRALRPTILWAYPSSLRSLRREAGYRLREHVQPRLIITASEVLDEVLRTQILEDLGLVPYNFYGSLEAGRIAAECPARGGLHVNADHVILETRCGERAAREGEPGTVLITTLNARAMPFIRYELGDRVVRLAGSCSCGSPFPLIAAPLGRDEDVIMLPSGRIVPAVWCTHFLRPYGDVLQFRIVQERVDHLTIHLVTRRQWGDAASAGLRREMVEQLAEPVTVDVRVVDTIPEEKDKFRSFISHLSTPR
jgi:phenylacetate-CoA ligase